MRMLQEELQVRRRWLAGTKMLRQETQVGDIDISTMEMVNLLHCLISQKLTKNDCQELNKTDKASQSMTNQKNQNDRNKQQSNGDLSSSVVSFGILWDCLL